VASLPSLAVAWPALAQESAEPIAMRWSRPFPRLCELAVSGDGQRIAALSLDGILAYFDLEGHPLWERPSVAGDALTVSRSGDLLVAWSRSGRADSRLLFFDGVGRCFAAPRLARPPTCIALSGVGKLVAVGADDAVSLFRVGPKGLVTRQIQAAGRIRRVLAGFGDTFLVITEPPCRVALIKSRGTELWHRELPEETHCSAVLSTDGKQLALAYEKSVDRIDIELRSWKNEELWKTSRPGRSASVRMNAAGGFVLLAYDHLVEHQQQTRYERRLAYLGEGGVGGWTKGGALTAPLPVALDSRGEWLVALDNERSRSGSRFRLYDKDGNRQWIYTAPAGVHLAVASANGRTIAVYQADGTLSVLRVNGAAGGG
jgi:hypothetical protein